MKFYNSKINLHFSGSLISRNETSVVCDKNKCYRNVNASHQILSNLIIKLSAKVRQINLSGITQLYNNLDSLSNHTKLLQNKTNKDIEFLNSIEKQNAVNQKNLTSFYDKIADMTKFKQQNFELNKTITDLDSKYKSIKNVLYSKSNANEKCLDATNKQLNLTNNVHNLKNFDKKLAKNFSKIKNKVDNLNNNIKTTFQIAVKTKNDLDKIEVPEQAVENYLNETENKLNHSVMVLKQNGQLLEDILSRKFLLTNICLYKYCLLFILYTNSTLCIFKFIL